MGQSTVDIVSHITANGVNTVVQAEAVANLLKPTVVPTVVKEEKEEADEHSSENSTATSAPTTKMAGYRVQVFSDNNQRTAKNEARSKSRDISARFPQYRTYVMYTSPYWRLKVGDFKTQAEAEAAAHEIRQAFPAYSKEVRVVRDRITVQN